MPLLPRNLLLHALFSQRHDDSSKVDVHPDGRRHQQAAVRKLLREVLPEWRREHGTEEEGQVGQSIEEEQLHSQQDELKNGQHSIPTRRSAHYLRPGQTQVEE